MYSNRIAFSVAGIVFVVGAALAILFYQLKIEDSAVIIALLLTPLAVYGIVSGNIIELSAPGGWSAKFREVVRQKVSTTATPLTDQLSGLQKVDKEGLSRLEEITKDLKPGIPVSLVLYFGKRDYYVASIVKEYVDTLLKVDPDAIIILVDNDSKHFVCMIESKSFLELLATDAETLIQAISNRDRRHLVRFAGFIFKGIRNNRTNVDALKEMKELNVSSLVVLNEKEEPISIVKRDEIIHHLLDKLTD